MKRLVILGVLAVVAAAALSAVAVEVRRDAGTGRGRGQPVATALGYPEGAAADVAPQRATSTDAAAESSEQDVASSLAFGEERERAEPAANAGAGGATASSAGDQFLDRKVAMTGSMNVQVKSVGAAFEDIGRIATAAGGFVASSTFGYQGEDQIASVTVRVPAERFQDVLAQVRSLAEKVDGEETASRDLTEQYTDLQSQMRNLQRTEERYLELLGRAQTINEILQLEDRLQSVRGQIEQIQGRIHVIEHTTDFATLTIHLRPVAAAQQAKEAASGGPDPLRAAREAWEASLVVLGNAASGLLLVVVFSWWLAPVLAVLGFLAVRLVRSRRPQAAG